MCNTCDWFKTGHRLVNKLWRYSNYIKKNNFQYTDLTPYEGISAISWTEFDRSYAFLWYPFTGMDNMYARR